MALFHFPKYKHVRTQKPRAFRRYQTYQKFLRIEFSGVCVYCRTPKMSNPSQIFSVDHYRPKSNPRFSSLSTEYSNLYYCCHSCNSRKSTYWPANEAKDPWIVNPCDFAMADHLKLDGKTGLIKHSTSDGDWTIELLQLNSESMEKYRRSTMTAVKALEAQRLGAQSDLEQLEKEVGAGTIDKILGAELIEETISMISELDAALLDFGVGRVFPAVRSPILGVATTVP